MTTKDNKYQNSKIYKIVCNITGEVYFGATTEKFLCSRIAKHRNSFKRYKDGKYPFNSSFQILERGNYNIILIENFNCNSKDELFKKERDYIENNECVNRLIPIARMTQQERKKIYDYNNKDDNYEKHVLRKLLKKLDLF